MALSDYMPYGAPELLDAAPARMARSTMLASLFVALLVAALGTITSRQVQGVIVPPEVTVPPDWITLFDPPPPTLAPPKVDPAPPRGEPDAHSEVTPRPDLLVPPDDFNPFVPPDGSTGDGLVDGRFPVVATPGNGPAADPLPTQFVYTDEIPVLVHAIQPRYPDLAREAGVEGIVTVQMLVGLNGRVLRAIIAPHGSVPMLDEAALEAARANVFTPALANNRPVKVWVSQLYRFRLH